MKLGAEHEYFIAMIQAYVAGSKEVPSAATSLAISDSFDWEWLLEIVCVHPRLLLPLGDLFYESDAPWDTKAELASHAKPMQEHTVLLMNELSRLQSLFKNAEIDVLTLKGPTIALQAYSNPKHRFCSDLDLLVSKADLAEACELLKRNGYQSPKLLRSVTFYEEQHFHYIFQHEDAELQNELHWELTEPDDFVRFELDGIWNRAANIELLGSDDEQSSTYGTQVTAMCDADMILHMVSQSLPSFTSVGRLLDVALLVKRDRFDEKQLASLAMQQNVATPLWIALVLTENVCGVAVSETLKKSIQPDWLRRKCILQLPIMQRMISCPSQHTGLSRLLLLLCCPDWKTSIHKLLKIALPGETELYKLGYLPNEISFSKRIRVTIDGVGSIGKMVLYMAWRILPLSSSR